MRLTYLVCLVLSVAVLGSANIQSDLTDFYDILPKIRISYIIAKHYLFDGDFRTGFKYLKSSNFQALLKQEFASCPEIQAIADYLGYPINISYIQRNFRSLSIPLGSADDFAHERTFTSFVDEVVEYLPQEKFRNLIRNKVTSNAEFANLYEKIMDPQFKSLVYRAKYSSNLNKAIETLERNNVHVDHMLAVAFELLNQWKL